MRRTVLNTLLAISLPGLLWVASGCGGQETISDRADRAHQDYLEDLAQELDEGGETAPAPAETATPTSSGALLALQGEELPELEPLEGLEEPAALEAPAPAPADRGETARPAAAPRGPLTASEQALDVLRQERAFELEEARYHAQKGEKYFQEGNYPAAAEAYRTALDLNSTLEVVRERYHEVLTLMEERVGEVPIFEKVLRDEEKVKRDQTLAEIGQYLAQARAALSEKRLGDAEGAASKAVDRIQSVLDYEPAARQEAENLLVTIRREKKRLEAEREQQLLEAARSQAGEDLREESEIRYRQVQQLLRKAMELMRLEDYEKTIEVAERIIELDPDNRVAQFWIRDAQDQLIKQRRFKLVKDRLENQELSEEIFAEASIPYNDIFVFPGDEEWRRAQERSKSVTMISTEDPEWIRRIKNSLEGTRVNFVFDSTPLDDVVQQLRTFTGVGMLIDPDVDPASQIVTMNLQGLTAQNALNLILDNVGLTYTFKENVLYITTPGQEGGRVEFAIYNVQDLLNKIKDFEGPELILRPQSEQGGQPIAFTGGFEEEEDVMDPDILRQHIVDSTGGDVSWEYPKSIDYHNGQFLVEAPRELHAQVQTVLSQLRQDSDLFVVIEARFIDVNDDFLEDIGIDSRALGAVNNFGTPFGNILNDNRTGGQDLGFTQTGNPLTDVALVMGQDRWAGRLQHIVDGFTGTIRGDRLTGGGGVGGLTLQSTWLEPFQINTILRAVQERSKARELTAPVVTAHNGQRVYVSVITQRAYIADYNLVSGGTGFAIIEVADPEVQTFQEGVILDVDPVISHDKKYVTLDVKPTLATLIGGVISTILISLGSFTNVAFQVPIGVPQISLQQSWTSVTVPNGGTVLLGGFKSLNQGKYTSYFPILGQIPLLGNFFKRRATISEKRSLVILVTARIVDLRGEEAKRYNVE